MNKKTKGFTIIEVVLVLAIAGLIFLIVFLALPALQRNQRDTQRRSDLGRLVAGWQTYQSNNSNSTPAALTAGTPAAFVAAGATTTTLANLIPSYVDTFNDPSTNSAYSTVANTNPTTPGQIAIYKGTDCASAASATGTKTIFKIAVEQGTNICQTN